MEESGRKIGEKLFVLLSSIQKKELAQFVRDYEAGNIPAALPCTILLRGQYFIPPQADQPLTEIREGDLYFCLEQRLVTVRSQVIPLTVKEFEIFALLYRKEQKRCTVCGQFFLPGSNRAKYCKSCAAIIHRRQKTASDRKRRAACGQLESKKP